jgi:hypothetical protein
MTKAYPIDNVDEVVERALAKLNISDDPESYLIAKCVIPVNSVLDHCPPRERGTFMEYDEKPLDIMNAHEARWSWLCSLNLLVTSRRRREKSDQTIRIVR